jgi:gliding motility-associated-like protein
MRKLLFAFFLLLTCFANAQELSRHNWYFGNSTHAIRFDRTNNDAELITKNLNQPFGIGGSGVATDHTNRNLLFYTDGANIYDANGQVMPNGAGLGGASVTNQPVALCPVPGQANQFFVFTRDGGGTVTMTTVDMTQFGNSLFPAPATGDVVIRNQPVGTGLTNRSEAMLLISSPLDTAYWLITHEVATANYTVTEISEAGITNTTFGGLGFDSNPASFSYHAASGRLAVAPQDPTLNIITLLFDNETGALTFERFLFNTSATATTEAATYDTEFSFNGQFLYISRTGDTGIEANLLQYDLTNPSNTVDTITTLPSGLFRSWGIQMAPDSSIYHLYQASAGGAFLVGRLSDTDSVATATTYLANAFGNIDFAAKQFPAFAPKARITLTVSFIEDGLCSNSNTTFFPTVTPGADSLVWDFGDGNFSNNWSPVHTYDAGGTFPVRVRAFLKGDTASFLKNISITQFDLSLTLVQDTTACECELPINNGEGSCPDDTSDDFSVEVQVQGGSPTSTQWFGPGGILTGQTTSTLRPDSAGYYYVVVTDASGCAAHAGVSIKEYGLQEQRANIWYFGNRAGIDFNDGTVPISNTVMDAPEGCAIVCDQNGQTIFFTDGVSVWDRDFNELATGIGGDLASTQSAFIMPVAGDETLYYIFTTQNIFGTSTFELRYSLYDLKANNGSGDLVQQNILLFAKSTERITGNDNWLIAHEYGNNSFRAYNISPQGIGSPVISSIGSDHNLTIQANGEGYMKLGAHLAVALSTPGVSNVVELFDFDNATGIVSNFRTANLNNTSGQVYGVEFSPGGNKLYATLSGASSQLFEFSIDSLGNPYLKNAFPSVANRLGAIQTGPDGQIYVAVEGQSFLGTISPNEDTTQVSGFVLNSFALLGGTNSRLGLPNFAQNVSTPAQQPSITVTGVCLGSPTVFLGTGTDNIDEFSWRFLQLPSNTLVGSGTGDSTSFTFATAGDYLISLRITNRCGLDSTLTEQITIVAPPASPSFLQPGQVPVLCSGSIELEATPATNPNLANLNFLWTTGETTRTITVSQQSIIGVTISDINGCTSNGSLLVADNRPQVELGPDLTICEDTPISPLNAQNPNLDYTWTVNGANTTTTQTRNVDTSAPGVFEYKVIVLDPFTTCSVADSVTFTINASPVFTATPTDATGCATADGEVAIALATAGGSYSIFFTGPPAFQAVNQPGPINQNITGIAAGSYGLTVIDDLSGCPTTSIVGIANAAITVTATQNGTCDPDIFLDITHNVVSAFTYRIINATNLDVDTGADQIRATPFTSGAVPGNDTYVVEITRTIDNCVSTSAPILVNQGLQVTIDGFTTDCGPSGETIVTVSSADAAPLTFDWSASEAGSINGANNTTSVTLNPGTWNLIVEVDNATLCPVSGPFTATAVAPFNALLTQSDPCLNQVSLNASPVGNFTYLWTRTPAPDPIGGQSLALTTADDDAIYTVTVRSGISGCTSTSAPLQVNVVGEFSATLSSTPPCEGTPFTLSAATTQLADSYSWTLNGSTISGASTATLQDTRDGLYEVTANRDVCSDEASITIENAPTTPGLLLDIALICNDPANGDPETSTVLLNPGNGFSSLEWFKDGVSLNIFDPTFTATEPGIYSVDLINNFGCPSSDRTTIVFECEPRIVAPTAFRPGSSNEQTNDFYVFPFFISEEGFEVFIFNRWGEMVYQSTDLNFRWNGSYKNGATLPAGTYAYVVKYKSSFRPEDGTKEQRGGVVLVR